MRFVDFTAAVAAALVLTTGVHSSGDQPIFVHAQRYAMGTMFDIAVYHPSRTQAERGIEAALAEIVRLDHVLSHFDPESDLSKLAKRGRGTLVDVDPALYDVLNEAMEVSRRSGGSFDVTVGPLVRVWQAAQAAGQPPSPEAIAKARRCVGFEKVRLVPPDRVQLDSDCVSIDLGGIGKGYAVERAVKILHGAGLQHAVVNAGQSSISAIGHPPDRNGWLADLDVKRGSGLGRIELRDASLSTSRQERVPFRDGDPGFGDIIDPARGRPIESSVTVVVRAANATHADALSTTLLLLPIAEGKRVLEAFPSAAAVWLSASGDVIDSHRDVRK